MTISDVLKSAESLDESKWLFLPRGAEVTPDTPAYLLELEEVAPDEEDAPDAGVPQFAKDHELREAMHVATIQDIVDNAKQQKPDATLEDLLHAFQFYYDRDAFIDFARV